MSIDEKAENSLKGQIFIGTIVKTDDNEGEIQRRCGMCYHRYGGDNYQKKENDCGFVPSDGRPTPKQMFGFMNDQFLPEQIGDEEVGHYCPYFRPYT